MTMLVLLYLDNGQEIPFVAWKSGFFMVEIREEGVKGL